MIRGFFGSDTEAIRAEVEACISSHTLTHTVFRVTDAHTPQDIEAALSGGGLFGGLQLVVLDGVYGSEDLRLLITPRLAQLRASKDLYVFVEKEVPAAERKVLEKYAESVVRHDAKSHKEPETIFGLVRALQSRNKKELWVGYQGEIAKGKVPEAIHGILFFAAKDGLLRNPTDARYREMVAELAELPHMARKAGCELEYALEQFILS